MQTPIKVIPRQRLSPPSDLDPAESEIWLMVVDACSAEHFKQSDIPLMVSYCQAYVQLQRAAKQLKSEPLVIPTDGGSTKVNPIVSVHKSLSGTVSNLAMRLRLSPSTRIATKAAATGSDAPPLVEDAELDELLYQP
ncbi:MAG: P27 family phage terminase small subunit [Rhodothermales bacterium]